jgi:monoamine oxidase
MPYADRFYRALSEVTADLPVAEFLEAHFADPKFEALRRSVTRTVEGYDAADPRRFSTLALREEWMARDDGEHGRIAGGYGALIDYLAGECRRHGAVTHLDAAVSAIEDDGGAITARCRDGRAFKAAAAILAVPLPLLSEIALPAAAGARAATAVRDIGFGNVVKLLLRFDRKWWADLRGGDLADLSFVLSNAPVPTWWTQYPDAYPVLTGWYAGPKADRVSSLTETELVEMGLESLAEIFGLSADQLGNRLVAARAINWGTDPFARGAYSYATPKSREALALLRQPVGALFFSGEAFYVGPDMGTVEAALASGQDTARLILAGAQ